MKSPLLEAIEKIESNRKVILITGGIGSGKTLTMSYLAHQLKDHISDFGGLYANYALNGKLPTHWIGNNTRLTPIICIDEYRSQSLSNVIGTEDDSSIVFLAAQLPSMVPSDVMKSINMIITTSRVEDKILATCEDHQEEINILENKDLYDAFEVADFSFCSSFKR